MKIGRIEITWKKKYSKAQAAMNLAEQAHSRITKLEQLEEKVWIMDKAVKGLNNRIDNLVEIQINSLTENQRKLTELVEQLGNK